MATRIAEILQIKAFSSKIKTSFYSIYIKLHNIFDEQFYYEEIIFSRQNFFQKKVKNKLLNIIQAKQ